MQIRPTAFTIGLIIHSFITLFFVYTEFGIGSISNSSNVVINTDNESTYSETIDVNGNTAVYTPKDGGSSLMWIDDNTSFFITSTDDTTTKEILVKIAQSLK